MPNLGLLEILIIAFILILLFGGKKIPELVRGVTDSITEFKKAISEEDDGHKKKNSTK